MSKLKSFLFAAFGLLLTAILLFSGQSVTQAKEDNGVQLRTTRQAFEGKVFYDTNNLYTMHGTKNGAPWSDTTASLAVQYPDGHNEMVFCVAPGVPLVGGMWTEGYEGIESSAVDRDALIAACIWQNVFPNKTQHEEIASRAVVWNYLSAYNLNITSIDGIPEFPQLKQTLTTAVDNYKKTPSFDKTTVNLEYGKTTKLDSGGVDLRAFDSVVSNDANVNFAIAADGLSVNVTPTDPVKATGTYAALKNYAYGTPIIWTKENSQTVVTPRIADPASYSVKFAIKTVGDVDILKLDHDSGKALPNFTFRVTFPDRKDLPAQTVKTGTDGKAKIKGVPHGTRVIAKEIDAPAPYVLGAAFEESDEVEGIVEAGKTITLTKKNKQAKGQITVDKSGKESNKDMWNGNYSLDKTTYEVRKDKVDGPIAETFETDASGFGKTNPNLDFGTYYLVESKAGNGFAKTFEPQKIVISYENQLVAVVVKNAKGTNQEVTGSNLLTKEDSETKEETQGKATFEGAEYSLFNKDGSPVKWNEKYKPELLAGTKVDNKDKNIVLVIDDNRQVGVKHLALGDYYWQETKAPEGYQIDKTKHNFSVTYKDQDTKIIETKSTSKENVIKFSIGWFKYVDSKSGDIKSGYNGIDFTLTPLDPTKGEEQKTTTDTDANGYDGAGEFKDIPFGDYVLKEVAAPEGYKTIKDLYFKSSFDAEKRIYTFTATEDGQKEPVKTLSVPESKINEGSNKLSFGKFFFTNKLVTAPEIETLFVTTDGNQKFDPTKDMPLIDNVSQKFDKSEIGNEKYWETQIHKKDLEGNYSVVATIDEKRSVKAEEEKFEVTYDYKANTVKAGEQLVATHKVYNDEEKTDLFAEHYDLENEKQTLTAIETEKPSIETLFVTMDGNQKFDPSKDLPLVDKVDQKFTQSSIGTDKYWVTQIHAIDIDGKDRVVETIEEKRVVKEKEEKFDVNFAYKANTVKHGEKLVATHKVYNDKDHEDLYAEHYDLENEKQTLTAVEEEKPLVETLYLTIDGKNTFDVTKDVDTEDTVKQYFPESQVGQEKYWVQQVHKVDKDGKGTVLETIEEARKVNGTVEEFKVAYKYLANTLKDGEKLVFTHIVYNDKEHTDEYARHFDLSNEKQTLTGFKPEAKPTPASPAAPSSPAAKGFLPQTAAMLTNPLILISALALVAGAIFMLKTRKKEGQEK